MNARLHVSGGALGGGRMVEDASSVAGVLLGLPPWNRVLYVYVSSGLNDSFGGYPALEIPTLERYDVAVACIRES